MAKWRWFAERELPTVIRELGLPCARTVSDPAVTRCPKHGDAIGPVTRMCLTCHQTAWDEVARRYRKASQGAGGKEKR